MKAVLSQTISEEICHKPKMTIMKNKFDENGSPVNQKRKKRDVEK
jgi:hypothetical protein